MRSALTTILVPQPLTSNPQPKPYRYSPVTQILYNQTQKQICFHTIKPNFPQGFLRDTNLTKSPEIRHFSALDFISLTANRPSPHEPYAGTYPPEPACPVPDIPYAQTSANRESASADYMRYTIPVSASSVPDS